MQFGNVPQSVIPKDRRKIYNVLMLSAKTAPFFENLVMEV